jgi:NitT/TauT family transport system substrate-binding protein
MAVEPLFSVPLSTLGCYFQTLGDTLMMLSSFSRRSFLKSSSLAAAAMLSVASCGKSSTPEAGSQGQIIKLGLNLWAGFMPWKVAEVKNFFESNGVKAEVIWFPVLSDQLTAFNAGKVDVIGSTTSDFLSSISGGVKAKVISITDVSLGADAIVAKPSIQSVKDLVGKQASVELGTVGHLLFLKALEKGGVPLDKVKLVNQSADTAIASLISGKTDVVYSYEPFVSQAVASGKGKVIFSSKDIPGIVPDLFVVRQEVLDRQPEDIQKILKVWYQTLEYRTAHLEEVLSIEAKQAGVSVADYKNFLKGFKWLTPQEAQTAFKPGSTPESLPYAAKETTQFMLAQKLITKEPPAFETFISPQFLAQQVGAATAVKS